MKFTISCLLLSAVLVNGDISNLFGVPGEGYIIEVLVGTPKQKFNVLIDTGSANFALSAASHPNVDHYFVAEKSTSYKDEGDTVSVVYTQGSWFGELASDVVLFPTLNSVTEVRTNIAFIKESNKFYMNGSNWQGILGLAYSSISKPNPHVLSWIESLQMMNGDRTMAFSLKLCGIMVPEQHQHTGSFEILNNVIEPNTNLMITPVIKDWFYEVVITGIRVAGLKLPLNCKEFNAEKAIIDSGTTNLRLPTVIYESVLKMILQNSGEILRNKSLSESNLFWYEGKILCWDEVQDWSDMPTIGVELAQTNDQYFVIELPGGSYIRQASTRNSTFCYKFGIESSYMGTILGVVTMEGFNIVFNRTAKWVGFEKTNCGPNVTIHGPYTSKSILKTCSRDDTVRLSLLEIAAYIVCVLLLIAAVLFLYLLIQWLKEKYFRIHVSCLSVSLSHASLINEE